MESGFQVIGDVDAWRMLQPFLKRVGPQSGTSVARWPGLLVKIVMVNIKPASKFNAVTALILGRP